MTIQLLELLDAKHLPRTLIDVKNGENFFSQGDPADSVYQMHKGKAKIVVLSEHGREAVIGIVRPEDFFGEQCLCEHSARVASIVAIEDSTALRINKTDVLTMIHEDKEFSEIFLSYLLLRNARIEEDLVDHMFNSSEKRLARLLLLMANFGKDEPPETILANVSQETLAHMIGTTRSRVNVFMNKFRRLGYIDYNDGLRVHRSLLNIILRD